MRFSDDALRALSRFGLTSRDVAREAQVRRHERKRVLQLAAQLDSALPPRQIAVVLGPSGSGKTTLLRAVARRVRARDQRAAWARPRARMHRGLRVIDAICADQPEHADHSGLTRALRDLASCGLADARLMVAPVRNLSQGELARLSLAVALSRRQPGEPVTLLVDEFAATLDDDTARGVAVGLARLVARDDALRVILATHRPQCALMTRPAVIVRL